MKIGILTFHYAHNYGAMLQAYALVTKLNLMGYDAEIIDYRLPYIYEHYETLRFYDLYKKYRNTSGVLISFMKTVKKNFKFFWHDKKWNRFESFLSLKLKKTLRIYSQNLSPLNYDIFICGSDQIWNAQLTNGLQKIYFAATAAFHSKRIAYAASCGSSYIDESDLSLCVKFIKQMNMVSVREQSLKIFLEKKINMPLDYVLDPVFLLTESQWNVIAEKIDKTNYILTYSFDEDDLFFEAVDKVANFFKKTVIRLCYNKINNQIKLKGIAQINNAGPQEFLGYFRNADFIITNSFHGTAFSILYQKQFICLPPKKNRERIDSILTLLDLSDRVVVDFVTTNLFIRPIDFEKVQKKLFHLKNESFAFLEKACSQS